MSVTLTPDGRVRLTCGRTELYLKATDLDEFKNQLTRAKRLFDCAQVFKAQDGQTALLSPSGNRWRMALIDSCGCYGAVHYSLTLLEAQKMLAELDFERVGTLADAGADWLP